MLYGVTLRGSGYLCNGINYSAYKLLQVLYKCLLYFLQPYRAFCQELLASTWYSNRMPKNADGINRTLRTSWCSP